MQIYLPIAEMSANIMTLIGMGSVVGFMSGMFGVGGGFLMTPLLIFIGIPGLKGLSGMATGTEGTGCGGEVETTDLALVEENANEDNCCYIIIFYTCNCPQP